MDAARREKKEHGTLAFPFQIYPALDGSEADDSDFIPYHWHPELEIITVDAGHVSLTIADHTYEARTAMCSSPPVRNCTKFVPPDGRTSSAHSFLRWIFSSSPAPTRANLRCSRRSRRDGCGSTPASAPVNPGRTKSVRCSHRLCARGKYSARLSACREAALLGIVAVCAQYDRLIGHQMRPGADYKRSS